MGFLYGFARGAGVDTCVEIKCRPIEVQRIKAYVFGTKLIDFDGQRSEVRSR